MNAIESELQKLFAEFTRYPIEILDLQADLEEELGIDSVKRAEIFAAFQERYRLHWPRPEKSPQQRSQRCPSKPLHLRLYWDKLRGLLIRSSGAFQGD